MMSAINTLVERKESLIKGRIAEALVKELFTALKMDVYAYGIECQFPHLANLHRNGQIEKNIALQSVANQPDFIICAYAEQATTLHRVEVKFRAKGKINISELSDYDDDVVFIFIDMKTFYILEKSTLDKKYKKQSSLSFTKLTRLSQDNIFAFEGWQKKMVYEFSQYVSKYLGHPQLMAKIQAAEEIDKKDTPILKRILKRLGV